MVFSLGIGSEGLRKEVIDSMVKQVAARTYKFKQAVAIVPTSAWTNTFFREDLAISDGPTGNKFKGIPRGANFPHGSTKFQEISVRIVKYGSEVNIPWEDILSNDINIQARNIVRRTEEVVKSVDDTIWDELTEDRSGTGIIQSFAIGALGLTRGGSWNQSSAAIIDNLMEASQVIAENGNYDVSNLMCFVSPRDKRSIMKYLSDKGAQWDSIATDIATNGRIAKVAGITIVESTSVTASYALVVKPKTCATYKELVSLRSTTIDDPYKSLKIRIVEEGTIELTDPKAVVLISNTQAA